MGDGTRLTIGAGLTVFNGANTYTGQTRIAGGALLAADGAGVHKNSNINFIGTGALSEQTAGVLLTNGAFNRQVGALSNRVQWTGSGGFGALGGALTVNLGGTVTPQTFTWGAGGFVPTGEALVFGSVYADSIVTFRNNIDLSGDQGRIAIMDNPDSDGDFAIVSGVISNGELIVGATGYEGRLVLTGANTFAGGLTVAGGLVEIAEGGSLNDDGAVTVNLGAALILGAVDAIGVLVNNGMTTIMSDLNVAALTNDRIMTLMGSVTTPGHFVNDGIMLVLGERTITAAGLSGGADAEIQVSDAAALTVNLSGDSLYSGLIVGDGALIKAGDGALTLTAAQGFSGGTIIRAGGIDTSGGGSLHDEGFVTVDAGAMFRAGTADTVGLLTADGTVFADASLATAGLAGGGSVTVASNQIFTASQDGNTIFAGVFDGSGGFVKQGAGALTLTGAMAQAGALVIEGGRMLTRDGGQFSDLAAIIVGGDGHLDIGVADVIASLGVAPGGRATIGADVTAANGVEVVGGVIDGAATLTGPTYVLEGATVSANLGAGALTSTGQTFLSGAIGAETVTVSDGVLTLMEVDILNHQAALNVLSNATLALLGGDQTVRTLNGAGIIELFGHRLNITSGGAFSGLFLGAGAVEVDTGVLTPSADIDAPDSPFTVNQTATAQINPGVSLNVQQVHVTGGLNVDGAVRAQTLNVGDGGMVTVGGAGLLDMQEDSTIAGGLMLHSGATLTGPSFTIAGPNAWLGGNGVISGSVVLGAGASLRPGASPGVLGIGTTAEPMDFTAANGSSLEFEIAGTGGAGAINGHDQLIVSGRLIIEPDATLVLERFPALGAFEPSLGDRFEIFDVAVGAISGVFGTVTSTFGQGVILNLSTGEVVGTGATPGQALTETLGSTANERAMIRQLLAGSNGGVEQYRGGVLIANALQARAVSAAAASAAFQSASPEGYAGFIDYGLHATRFKLDTAMRADTRPMGGLGAFVAGDLMRIGSSKSDDGAGYTLRSGGAIFGVAAGFDQVSLRAFAGFDTGRMSTSRITSDASGWVVGVSGAYTPEGASLLTFSGGLAYGDSTHEGRRRTFSDVSRFDDVSSDAFVATAAVSYRAIETDRFRLTPAVGFSIASGSTAGFDESNGADFEALSVSGQSATRTAVEVGLGAEWRLAEATGLRADAQIAYDFADSARSVTARVANDPGVFSVRAEGLGALSTSVGFGLDYAPTTSTRVGVSGRLGVTENSAFSAGGSLQVELRF